MEPPVCNCNINEWYFVKNDLRVRDCNWVARNPTKRCKKNGGFGTCLGQSSCSADPRYDYRMRARVACPCVCEGF